MNVTGSGTVTSSPAGINCPSTCSAGFVQGTQVTLTATPADGWGFSGWGGACSGVGNCVVTMSAAQSVTATFAQTQYTLNVSVAGNGTVTSSPSGVSCPSLCTNELRKRHAGDADRHAGGRRDLQRLGRRLQRQRQLLW